METDEKEKVDFSELIDERQIALRAPLSPLMACMLMCALPGVNLSKLVSQRRIWSTITPYEGVMESCSSKVLTIFLVGFCTRRCTAW